MRKINLIDMLRNMSTKGKVLISGGVLTGIILVAACLTAVFQATAKPQQEEKVYVYDVAQQKLADEVKAYLSQYLNTPESTLNELANVAVQNYDTVMASDTDVISDEITEAVKQRVMNSMVALIENANMEDDSFEALSSGVTQLIWTAVLEQLSANEFVISENFKEEYNTLVSSLQSQIDTLNERKMKVSINAKVIDNTEIDVTGEDLLSGFEELNDDELSIIAEKLGMSVDELLEYFENSMYKSNEDMKESFENELEELRKEFEKEKSALEKEIASKQGKVGATGKAGAAGKDGKNGVDGKDGEDGEDGKTTYIAYADDEYGTNFSLVPTETAKYVGTCISSATFQPTDYNQYSNWQEYRSYVITSTTDPDTGLTTVHIY